MDDDHRDVLPRIPVVPKQQPDGLLLPHLSARYRTAQVDALYAASGGFQKALDWINADPDNYRVFFKDVWAKGMMRVSAAESANSQTIEDKIAALDMGEATLVPQSDVIEDARVTMRDDTPAHFTWPTPVAEAVDD